jgi:hypothetical protein
MWFLADPNSRRRFLDAAGSAAFHQAAVALFAWSVFAMAPDMNYVALAVLAIDVVFFLYPVQQKPILDARSPPPEPADSDSFVPETLLLVGPPAILLCWFLTLIWSQRTLTYRELQAIVICMPIVVGVVSRAIYIRMTRYHVGITSHKTSAVGLTMLGTWALSAFLFLVLMVCLLARREQKWKREHGRDPANPPKNVQFGARSLATLAVETGGVKFVLRTFPDVTLPVTPLPLNSLQKIENRVILLSKR